MASAVWVAGAGGIGGGEEGDAGREVRRDGSEGGAEVWVAFEITE